MLKISKVINVLTFVIVTSFVVPTAIAEPVEMLVSKNWGAYRYDNDGSRICFISSVPIKSKGKYDPKNRGDIRVFVSHGPGKAERDVVQVIAGYRYKPQSDVSLTIDGKSFKPHADAAFANHITPRIMPGSCFALDIDTPSDLQTLLAEQPRSQTAAYLMRSGIAGRLAEQQAQPERHS